LGCSTKSNPKIVADLNKKKRNFEKQKKKKEKKETEASSLPLPSPRSPTLLPFSLFLCDTACSMLVSIKKKRKLFLVRLAKFPWFAYYVAVSINPLVRW